MSGRNSGTPGAISTKLGTHIAIWMCKNLMYVLYIHLSPKHEFPKGIWMIHVVEEIKLLLLLGNGLKHIRDNVPYLLTWNVKVFTVGYCTEIYTYKNGCLCLCVYVGA
jgi:hypothetical protein